MNNKRLMGLVYLAAVIFLVGSFSAQDARAASAVEINKSVDTALDNFYREVGAKRGNAFKNAATGILVFPNVLKAGLGFGGEYGEGALRIGNQTMSYFNMVSASFGFQAGIQVRSIIIMFMTRSSLENFLDSKGWEVGVDGSVTVVNLGLGGTTDTTTAGKPIIAFIHESKGLMFNLTLEGSKITRIKR